MKIYRHKWFGKGIVERTTSPLLHYCFGIMCIVAAYAVILLIFYWENL